jgi:Ca-activated chloride channel homolog
MRFKDPLFFLLFLLWVPVIWMYIMRERRSHPAVRFPDLSPLRKMPPSPILRMRHIPLVLRLLASGALIIALARPQKGRTDEEVTTEGIDIMLVLDVSESMQALDFKPDNRLAVAKQTIKEFIGKRNHDRIGLVVFAARAFTKCPLTLDYNVLYQFIDQISFTEFSNATAVGTAIATAVNRIKDSPAKSKVIILATDGANNTGEIPPLVAAKAAHELGVKIYTIGVGREGQVPVPVQMVNPFTGEKVQQVQMIQSDLDEKSLTDIAQATGGRYFRARSTERLKEIYDQIDKMEKTTIKTKSYTSYAERFYPWLWLGFLLLMAEVVLSNSRLRRIP